MVKNWSLAFFPCIIIFFFFFFWILLCNILCVAIFSIFYVDLGICCRFSLSQLLNVDGSTMTDDKWLNRATNINRHAIKTSKLSTFYSWLYTIIINIIIIIVANNSHLHISSIIKTTAIAGAPIIFIIINVLVVDFADTIRTAINTNAFQLALDNLQFFCWLRQQLKLSIYVFVKGAKSVS